MAEPFKINAVTSSSPPGAPGVTATRQSPAGKVTFADTLAEAQNLKFSNHAQKRLQQREISLSDEGLSRLSSAVDKAEKRGGKESLVLMDDLAFIVNVKDRMVVTALDSVNRGDGVFTQIDSVVFAEPNQAGKDSGSSL
jgi:flagellar operon protein